MNFMSFKTFLHPLLSPCKKYLLGLSHIDLSTLLASCNDNGLGCKNCEGFETKDDLLGHNYVVYGIFISEIDLNLGQKDFISCPIPHDHLLGDGM